MYAVVEIGGHQYKVSEGDVLFVDNQNEESGKTLTFDRVMLVNDGDGNISVGSPVVSGATVSAELLDNVKADKVIVFKKKRRKGYQKKNGHRQSMSRIEIKGIDTAEGSGKKKAAKKKADKKEKAKAAGEKKSATKAAPKTEKKAAPKKETKAKETKKKKESKKKETKAKETKKKESKKKDTKKKTKAKAKKQDQVSTDMSAADAIDHIKNTPLDQLEGFVPDNEDRVTVTREWESKQED